MRASWVVKRHSARTFLPVPLVLPGSGLLAQHFLIRNPTVQALPGQHRQLMFSHIEPTAVLRRVVYLQAFSNSPRLLRLKGLVQGCGMVSVLVVHHQDYPFLVWVVLVHQFPHYTGPIGPGRCAP